MAIVEGKFSGVQIYEDGEPLVNATITFVDTATQNALSVYTDDTGAVTTTPTTDAQGVVSQYFQDATKYDYTILRSDNSTFDTGVGITPPFPQGSDLAVTDGGTGASTAAGARSNLGAASAADVSTLTSISRFARQNQLW